MTLMQYDQNLMHLPHSIRSRTFAVLLVIFLSCCLVFPFSLYAQVAENVAITRYDNSLEIFHPVRASGGMVATDQRLASEVGADILRQGGNAVDAAVAVGFALAVVLPYAGNLGGGGFMLIRDAKTGSVNALDFRETAPSAARRDMFLDQQGQVIPGKSTITPYSVAVPGTVAGLISASQQFGTLPLEKLLAPAIRLADDGFIVSAVLAQQFALQRKHLERWPSTREVFFKRKPDVPECLVQDCPISSLVTYAEGERLLQPDLAKTLRLIARLGMDGFYKGIVAQHIVDTLSASTRPMGLEDLATYRIAMREPARGNYRGYDIYSMPAPSSGGVHLIQMLNILERYPLTEFGAGSAQTIHLIAESARLAYADRSEYLGDPDFTKVPQRGLTAKAYADTLAKRINLERATPSKEVRPGPARDYESDQTTHFSVMDALGNVVSCTYTLNLNFGSGIVARGTGVLLNNEMDDFSAKPGAPNAFGLLGGSANAIEPGKRPLSSMTPVIVLKEGKPWLATGTPGGARIITTVLQTILNTIDFKMNIAEALSMPRVHHQWMPDYLRIEKGLSPDTIRLLKDKGHDLRVMPTMGRVQTVQQQQGFLFGATDPRNPDGAAIGIERVQ
jgi:gamma-glutamyltranspeptidase/glutathione hydrolase